MSTAGTAEPEWFQCGQPGELFKLIISPDCIANNVIIRCILKKARVYRTTQTVKLQSC